MPDLLKEISDIILTGNTKPIERFLTGIQTVDLAFGNAQGKRGVPMQQFELYGPTGCGKTTTAWFLSACATQQYNGNITMTSIEPFDPEQLVTSLKFYGYRGKVYVADGHTDEKTMDDAITSIRKDQRVNAYIFDSIGAVSPIAELEGNAGEANMGRRAKLVAVHARQLNNMIRNGERQLFALFINHVHQNLGTPGSSTTGGVTVPYLAANRVRLKRKEDLPFSSYSIEGFVVKNRFGWEDTKFWLVVLGGVGVHVGLSNVQGCLSVGLLEKPKSIRSVNRFKGSEEVLPSMRTLIEQALAGEGEWDVYSKALQGVSVSDGEGEETDA